MEGAPAPAEISGVIFMADGGDIPPPLNSNNDFELSGLIFIFILKPHVMKYVIMPELLSPLIPDPHYLSQIFSLQWTMLRELAHLIFPPSQRLQNLTENGLQR